MSVFTKIINREIPAHIVAENTKFIAFLDVNPNAKGHTLCVPKQEIDKIFDLEKNHFLELMSFSYDVAKAIEKSIICKRVGVSVVGLEVAHVHVHLIPLNDITDITFQQKVSLSQEEFSEISKKIKLNF